MEMNNVSKKILPKKFGASRAGTLVVCPLIALSQWKAEIEKFCAPDTLTVGVYHGPNRATEMKPEMLVKYDIVLTTYQVLEQDFRKMVSPNKVTCPNCKAKFKIDKLRVHLKYFCGDAARKTEAQARQRRGNHRDRPEARDGKTMQKAPKKGTKLKASSLNVSKQKKPAKVKLGLDSDSEISIPVDETAKQQVSSGKRPSRASAQSASKKLSASIQEWGSQIQMTKRRAVDSDDDSDFSSALENDDDEMSSSDDENIATLRVQKKPPTPSSLQMAVRRQAEALANLKKKSSGTKVKSTPGKKPNGGKKKTDKKHNEGKKKFGDVDDSSDDSTSARDPMEGIDLEELVDEAMAGSRCSLLHSFCWWRVVLDEAHFIKSRSSQTAAAAFALTSIHRWCLSGNTVLVTLLMPWKLPSSFAFLSSNQNF
jgi:SNF2-related domain